MGPGELKDVRQNFHRNIISYQRLHKNANSLNPSAQSSNKKELSNQKPRKTPTQFALAQYANDHHPYDGAAYQNDGFAKMTAPNPSIAVQRSANRSQSQQNGDKIG